MAKRQIIQEYLIKIVPSIDVKKYKEILSKFKKDVNETFGEKPKKNKLVDDFKALSKNTKNIDSILNTGLAKASGKLAIILASVKIIKDLMTKIVNSAKEFSNSMITASSAFVNKDVRNIMASFGVSGTTATGISKTTQLMGISTSDLKLMTPGQMELFTRLMNTWTESINSIDKNKLDYYNQMIQNFQSDIAIEKMKLQIELQKMLIDIAPSFESMLNSFVALFRTLKNLMTSPLVKGALEVIMTVINSIARLISVAGDALSLVFGQTPSKVAENYTTNSSTSSYVTNTSNTSNTYYFSDNSMNSISSSETEQNNKIISNAQFRTGRVL